MKNSGTPGRNDPQEKRIQVFGKEPATGRKKRAFDWLRKDGQTFVESVNKQGQLIRTREEYEKAGKHKIRKLKHVSQDHEKALRKVSDMQRKSGRLLYLPEFLISGN